MTVLQVYCDGGCRGNQSDENVGGWGVYLVWGDYVKELYGAAVNTTNNQMELTAAIEGLRAVKNKDVPTEVYFDSAYVLNGLTDWIEGWKLRGWVNSKKQPVANKELWVTLDEERKKFSDISFHKVKGHADNPGNIRADELANIAMDEIEESSTGELGS